MLHVSLRPSRYIAAALISVHLGVAATLLPLDCPAWAKTVLLVSIVLSLAHSVWRHAFLKSPRAVTAFELGASDHIAVEYGDGLRHEGRILQTTYVTPLMTVLNLRLTGNKLARHVLIVPDNVDRDDFRRLRVLLRWGYRREGSSASTPA